MLWYSRLLQWPDGAFLSWSFSYMNVPKPLGEAGAFVRTFHLVILVYPSIRLDVMLATLVLKELHHLPKNKGAEVFFTAAAREVPRSLVRNVRLSQRYVTASVALNKSTIRRGCCGAFQFPRRFGG